VARILPPGLALWGLLHDAGEAYLTDLPRPVKQSLPQFSELEDRVLRQVAVRFGLSWPMPPEVKLADNRLLATEARDLMAPWPDDWRLDVEPLPDRIVPLTWQDAERLFLAEFTRLTIR
jgi:transposase